MRVALDVSPVMLDKVSGLKTYIENFTNELSRIKTEHEFLLLYNVWRNPYGLKPLESLPMQFKHRILKIPRRIVEFLWKNTQIPIETIIGSIQVYHSFHLLIPPVKSATTLLTVHDCRYLKLPLIYSKKEVDHYRKRMELSLKRVDKVITVSTSTKNDLIEFFGFPENRIQVIYEGFDMHLFHQIPEAIYQSILKQLGLEPGYLLFVGSLEPRKNLTTLLKAISMLKRQRWKGKLVLAGFKPRSWQDLQFNKLSENLGIGKEIQIVGIVRNEILPYLMNGAFALLYPSLYEGFGLPVLEAMACGIPVIAGRHSSLVEVVGEGGLLVDIKNPEGIAKAVEKLYSQSGLVKQLVERASQQIKKFSWRKMAEEYLKVYEEII